MEQKQIASLENKIKKESGNIAGIIVFKDDNVVYENYFNQCSENDPIHIFSVTKSVVSMLFGIALGKGCIINLDEKVIDFFPNYQIKKGGKTIQHITIRNLLTMTASLDFLGGRGKIGDFRYAPIIGIDILSGILINTTGKSVLEFAQDNLFYPLGISVEKNIYFQNKEEQLDFYKSKGANGWVADPNGTNTAGWGLSLTTMDMAKLGQLYLNEGYWNGRQIISDKWIIESTQVQSVWKARHLKYGYLWWVIR